MDTRTYFNFPEPEPEPEFETFEAWAWRLVSEERRVIESLVRESLRERSAPAMQEAPPMPAGIPDNPSVRAAWSVFHSPENSRARLREAKTPVRVHTRRRPLHTFVADPDERHLSE